MLYRVISKWFLEILDHLFHFDKQLDFVPVTWSLPFSPEARFGISHMMRKIYKTCMWWKLISLPHSRMECAHVHSPFSNWCKCRWNCSATGKNIKWRNNTIKIKIFCAVCCDFCFEFKVLRLVGIKKLLGDSRAIVRVFPYYTKLTMLEFWNSSGNKYVMITNWINFDANLHFTWYFESRYVWLTTASTLIFKFMQYENANFVYYGKTRFNSRQNRSCSTDYSRSWLWFQF